jgi:branched-chain amino acid transport system substrate-binding protein
VKKKNLLVTLVCLSLLVIFTVLPVLSCKATAPSEVKTLKIGLITSLTGSMSAAFKSLYDAAKPTQDLWNQKGGVTVDGQKYNIEIVPMDDQSSPAGAVTAANKLIGDGVKFIIAPQFIPANMAIAPICEQAKVIRIQGMSVDQSQYGSKYYYNFDGCMTLYNIVPTYNYVVKNYPKVKKIAIIMADDPGGVAPREFTIKEAEKRGLEVVFNDIYQIGTEDFAPIVTKALEQKPDGIELVLGFVPWANGIIKSARDMGFKGPVFCGSPIGDINWLNSMLEPNYAYDIFASGPDVLSSKMLPIVQDHRKLVEKATNSPYTMDNLLPLLASWPLLQAIEKAKSLDTDAVVKTFENMSSIDTVFGKGKVTGQELVGINRFIVGPVPLARIQNGKVEFEFLSQ